MTMHLSYGRSTLHCLALLLAGTAFAAGRLEAQELWAELSGAFRADGSQLIALRSAGTTEFAPGIVVPDLVRKPLAEARQWARVARLPYAAGKYYIAPEKWRDEIGVETVGLQTPPAGVAVAPGVTVAVWGFVRAGEGQKIVTMPDLVGLDPLAARERLATLQLPLLATEADGGRVASQYPPAGRAVYEGTSVYLVIGP